VKSMMSLQRVALASTIVLTSSLSLLPLAHADGLPVNQNYFGTSPYTQAPQAMPQAVPTQPSEPTVNNTVNTRIDVDAEDMTAPQTTTILPSAPVNSNWTPSANTQQPQINAWPPQNTSIPAGQFTAANTPGGLRIAFQTPFNSETAQDGDAFLATAADDFWQNNQLLVPKGSVLRGRIAVTKKAGLINKTQEIVLNFDHMTMPDGTLKPLSYQMVPTTTNTTAKAIPDSQRFAYGMQRAGNTITQGADRGVEVARAKGGFFNYLLAVPAYTLKGVASGTLITTSTATKAIFGHKSDSIMVQPGDEFVIESGEAVQLLTR
jgi:hypothetical protein